MKERNNFVDCLRAYACLLVVIGHVTLGIRNAGINDPQLAVYIEKFIYTFHVPLFMFLSGYVYRLIGGWSRQKTRLSFIGHKFLNIGIPYVIFSCVYIIMNALTPGTNHDSSITDVLMIWRVPVAQYWFLYSLLFYFVLWALLSYVLDEKIVMIVFIVMALVSSCFDVSVPYLGVALPFALPFALGAGITDLRIDKFDTTKKWIIVIGNIVLFIIAYVVFDLTFPFKATLFQIIGIIGSIAFISIISANKSVEKFLIFISKYSFPIYLLHTIFTSFIRIILRKVGIMVYPVHLVLGISFGIVFPVIIAMICEKTPYLDFMFYPSKNIKKIKAKKNK